MGYNPFDFIGTDKRKRIDKKSFKMANNVVTEHELKEMIRETLNEGMNYKALQYFRKELWDVFKYALANGKRGEAAFYGILKKLVKKSKFYKQADNNQIELHGKMVFDKTFDDGKKWQKKNALNLFYTRKWNDYIKEFIESMEMFE